MKNPRIYLDQPLVVGETALLSDDAFGHLIRVLRLNQGDHFILFNGLASDGFGCEYHAKLINVSKKHAEVAIENRVKVNNESPLRIHLGQGISRGDRMDYTLQKSVELGVNTITPLFTNRCTVKLSGERLTKKINQWQKIVISACEQSGRCIVPVVQPAISLEQWLTQQTSALKLNLHPKANYSIMSMPDTAFSNLQEKSIRLLIGPEGGLNDTEILTANQHNFLDVLLGPRILRTETAALTALTALQCRFGDMN
jgi:16S rRNA (uracil1498-N3)-methyltransferase